MNEQKWFWQDANGLKADVDRHRAEETNLDERIAELEGKLSCKTDLSILAALRVYRSIRASLLQSKADVVDKIGRK